ncbi:GLPGLI family protein [Lacinutrix undariae]
MINNSKSIKQTLLVILITFSTQIFAQKREGVITYKSKIIKPMDNDTKSSSIQFLNDIIINNDFIDFELSFNNTESVFKITESLEEDNNLKFSIGLLGGYEIYYYNTSTKENIYQTESYGEFFIITDHENYKWTLTKESKKIENYTCYKATTIKEIKNSVGVFKRKVVAWYTPQIPLQIGPAGYNGLPGLILELQEKNKLYVARKIDINALETEIKKPTKGKKITYQEFLKIGERIESGH